MVTVVCLNDKQCNNGGLCVDNECSCPDGTFGAKCDVADADGTGAISVCTKDGGECQNGGECIAATEEIGDKTVDANYCKCPDGTFGAKCHGKDAGSDSGASTTEKNQGTSTGTSTSASKNESVTINKNSTDTTAGNKDNSATNTNTNSTKTSTSTSTSESTSSSKNDSTTTSGSKNDSTTTTASKNDSTATTSGSKNNSTSSSSSGSKNNSTSTSSSSSSSGSKNNSTSTSSSGSKNNGTSSSSSGSKNNSTSSSSSGSKNNSTSSSSSGSKNNSTSTSSSSSGSKNNGTSSSSSGSKNTTTATSSGSKNDGTSKNTDKNDSASGSASGNASGSKNDSKTTDNKKTEKDNCSLLGDECQNGGVCVLSSDGNYCSCPEGTSGTVCHGKGVCTLKCEHGSSCRHYDEPRETVGASGVEPTSFYCECVGNYKGLTCNIPFEFCPKIKDEPRLECLYGSKCLPSGSPATSYSCSCPEGRTGKSCESGTQSNIEDYNGSCFENDDCFNGGLCIRDHDAKTTAESGMVTKKTHCLCTTEWGGDNCEFKCDSLNCQHGSSCRYRSPDDDATVPGAYCDCDEDHYTGRECEIPIMKCPGVNGVQCMHGGTCVPSEEGDFYFCSCPPGRTGQRCEIEESNDSTFNPIQPTTSSTASSGNNNGISATLSDVPTPVALLTSLILLATIIALFAFVFLRKKSNKRSVALDDVDNEFMGGEDKNAESNGFDGGAVENDDGDDVFDYDTNGVVDVNLDDNEPVDLPAEKQIV